MKSITFGSKRITVVAWICLAVMLFYSNIVLAATHNIELSAETLPNGQLGYQMISHTSSEGATPS